MTCRDWRGVPATVTAPLYEAETRRWDALYWETRGTLQQVERARSIGVLPGFIVDDASGVAGWTFYLRHGDSLQVGVVVASSEDATAALVDQIVASEDARAVSSVMVFVLASAPDVCGVLARRGFAVERYLYMERRLDDVEEAPVVGSAWDHRDTILAADLMSRAYAGDHVTRPFAREGDPAAWVEYARQLTTTSGCGLFLPSESVLVRSNAGASLDGVVLTTAVGPRTGHLAQVAVDPAARGQGLGRSIVMAAMSSLRASQFERVTLLVGEQNAAARRLYRDLGFVETAEFVSAAVDQPRRSSSVALATGGASTLR